MKKLLCVLLCVLLGVLLATTVLPAMGEEESPFISGNYAYVLLEDGGAMITGYNGSEETLNIPDALDGHPVLAIGDRAFKAVFSAKEIVVPEGVTSIGNLAFIACQDLHSVSLPDSLTEIGNNPFAMCYRLETLAVSPEHPVLSWADGALISHPDHRLVYCLHSAAAGDYAVPQGVQAIGAYAFYECSQMKNVAFPDGLTTIGERAFSSCTGLTTLSVPEGVTAIGDFAFESCTGLAEVALPESLEEMGNNPFQFCENLTTIALAAEHPALALVDNVLFTQALDRLICYPCGYKDESYDIPEGVQVIGASAFGYCNDLDKINIPGSVTAIEDYAFLHCDGLFNLELPDGLVTIGDKAFAYCINLLSIDIPEGTTSIAGAAFLGCSNLKYITIPDSVSDIGKGAFDMCPMLTVTVGEGSYAESYCKENGLDYAIAGDSEETSLW